MPWLDDTVSAGVVKVTVAPRVRFVASSFVGLLQPM